MNLFETLRFYVPIKHASIKVWCLYFEYLHHDFWAFYLENYFKNFYVNMVCYDRIFCNAKNFISKRTCPFYMYQSHNFRFFKSLTSIRLTATKIAKSSEIKNWATPPKTHLKTQKRVHTNLLGLTYFRLETIKCVKSLETIESPWFR